MLRILVERHRRFALLWVAPAALALAWWALPLALGTRTLFLRDVLRTHLGLRAYLAEALRRGELPLVDPLRAGGQGLLGNLNAVPLYPDNLLLFFGSTLWQLNAHFWLHALAALAAMFWLARAWGLARENALAAASLFVFSGFFLSQLNLYNAVAPVALAPALAAALLSAARPERRRAALPALGALWALLLVGGDPLLAGLALATALALALPERRRLPWLGVGVALAAGTLLAAPQLVEAARLLPSSFRASGLARPAPGPSLLALFDAVVPLYFGRPEVEPYWGTSYFGGFPPLYFSIAPGVVALALCAAGASRRAPGRRVALALLGGSVAVGFSGPLGGAFLARVAGGGLLRFPVKLLLVAAIAGSLLAGRGLALLRGDDPRARRAASRTALALLLLTGGVTLVFTRALPPLEAPFRALFAHGLDAARFAELAGGWRRTSLLGALVAAVALVVVRRALSEHAAACLIGASAITQLAALAPLVANDDAAIYRATPPALERLAEEAVVVAGWADGLFGPMAERGSMRDAREFERWAHAAAAPYTGLLADRRYELDHSPEGLDTLLVHAAASALRRLDDRGRIRLLRATGVDHLLLERALAPEALEGVELESPPDETTGLRVYRIDGALPEAQLFGAVEPVNDPRAALDALVSGRLDPRETAVVAGPGAARRHAAGALLFWQSAPERIEVEAESPAGGALVLRRAWLPIWRAEIDGVRAPIAIANLTRLAIEMPPGRHRVRFWIDRSSLRVSFALALLGALLLAALAWRGNRADTVPRDGTA